METRTIMIMFEVIVAVAVIVIGISVAVEQGKSERVIKTYMVDDLALMVNAVVGVPGDVIIAYPDDVSDYRFLMDDYSITVLREGDLKEGQVTRKFQLPDGYKAEVDANAKGAKEICLEKKNYVIKLRNCQNV